jgi:hypothetical protein
LVTQGINTEQIEHSAGTLRAECTPSFTAASEKAVTESHFVHAGVGALISLHEHINKTAVITVKAAQTLFIFTPLFFLLL